MKSLEISFLPSINAIHPRLAKTNAEVARELNRWIRRAGEVEKSRPGSTGARERFAVDLRAPDHAPDVVSIDVRVLWQLLLDAYADGFNNARITWALERSITRQAAEDADLSPKQALAAALRHAGRGLRRAEDLYGKPGLADPHDDAHMNDLLAAIHDLAFRLDPEGELEAESEAAQ